MQAPKLTLFNGQDVTFRCMDTKHFVTRAGVWWDGEKVVLLPHNEPLETGVELSLLPVVSADRKYVRLCFEGVLKELAHKDVPLVPVTTMLTPVGGKGEMVPFTQHIQTPKLLTHKLQRTLCLPDGKTALLDAIERPDPAHNELGPPVLTKIPYIKRLIKNPLGKAPTLRTLVLVTPRLIVEKETRSAGAQESCEPSTKAGKLAKLLQKYHKACAEGKKAEARKLALKALALDPTCFAETPQDRMERLLNDSEFDGPCGEHGSWFWFIDRPSPMTNDRIHGGIE
jgi:hypothetical protein